MPTQDIDPDKIACTIAATFIREYSKHAGDTIVKKDEQYQQQQLAKVKVNEFL